VLSLQAISSNARSIVSSKLPIEAFLSRHTFVQDEWNALQQLSSYKFRLKEGKVFVVRKKGEVQIRPQMSSPPIAMCRNHIYTTCKNGDICVYAHSKEEKDIWSNNFECQKFIKQLKQFKIGEKHMIFKLYILCYSHRVL